MAIDIVTSPNDELHFSARHRPALPSGTYTVSVKQTLSFDGTDNTFESDTTKLAVFSPRFALRPEDISSVYPPADSSGQYGEVLPNIIFNRPTLPWERTCEKGSADPARRPWLALLVFSESELAGATKQVQISDLLSAPATPTAPNTTNASGQTLFASLNGEVSDQGDDAAHVIELPWGFLKQVLPAVDPDETSLVCHVRWVSYALSNSTSPENSVLIATRLPPPNSRIFAHVVSLENCYEGAPLKFLGGPPNDSDMVRLVSLYSWQFFCQPHLAEDFSSRMKNLTVSRLSLPQTTVNGSGTAKQRATALISSGFTILRHRFRQGDASVSWYHGPLLPGSGPAPSTVEDALPCSQSDALLLYDSQLGMLDVSYAAAWELGRLLMLENSLVAGVLFDFRRGISQAAIAQRQFQANANALHIQAPDPPPDFPANVKDWISKGLGLLQVLPFNYLVPDEAYLPQESLRFFKIDQTWRKCLIDGALTIGRFEADTLEATTHLQASLPNASSGFLMRSAVVSAFPGLLIDAYDGAPTSSSSKRLNVLRREILAPNILLVIFEGDAAHVQLHLSPQSIHFGIDAPVNGVYSKTLRDSRANAAPTVTVPFRNQPLASVIDLRLLAQRILHAVQKTPPSDADLPKFALEMIESVPSFEFSI
jgi:hypothetical protein